MGAMLNFSIGIVLPPFTKIKTEQIKSIGEAFRKAFIETNFGLELPTAEKSEISYFDTYLDAAEEFLAYVANWRNKCC